MHPVTEPCLGSLTSSHSYSSDTHTMLRGQCSTAKTESGVFHPFETSKHTAGAARAGLGTSASYLSSGLGRSASHRQLRLWLPFPRQLSEAQARIFTLPQGSPFPPRRLCKYTKQAAGQRAPLTRETEVILVLSSRLYVGDMFSPLMAQNYSFQVTGFSKQVRI